MNGYMLLDTVVMISVIGITTLGMTSAIQSIQHRYQRIETQTQDRLLAESTLVSALPTQSVSVTILPNGMRRFTWEQIPGRKYERIVQ